MSYNGYNYSPYFQHPDQQPANGQQQSYSQQRPGAGAETSYRTHAATPLNGYSSGQQQYPKGPSPSQSSSTTFDYRGYGRADDSSERISRGDATSNPPAYFEPSSRPYVDTSALGSLVYASALGRNSPSVEHTPMTQQLPSRSDSSASPAYGSNMSRPVNPSYQPRADSRGSGTASNTIHNRSVIYATAIAASALAQSQRQTAVYSENSAAASPTQTPYAFQPPAGNGDNSWNWQPNQQQPARQGHGSNREGHHTPTTYADGRKPLPSPSYQSPLTQPAQPSRHPISSEQRNSASQHFSTGQAGTGSDNGRRISSNIEQRISSPHQNYYAPTHKPVAFNEQTRNGDYYPPIPSKGAEEEVYLNNRASTDSQQPVKAVDRPPVVVNEKVNDNVSMASHTNSDHPMTVDPNQIFNQSKYQRRQAAAEVQAKAVRDAAKDSSQQEIMDSNSLASKQPQAQTSFNDDPPTSVADYSKEKREAEIKATFGSLFGKMRDLKAEDPSMFSEIWEKFLKGQPPIRSNPQAPNAAKEPQSSAANGSRAIELNSPIILENGKLPSPSLNHNQPSLMAEVNENSPAEQLRDLGKYPAQRRRRKSKMDKERLLDVPSHLSGNVEGQRQSSDATGNGLIEIKGSVPSESLDGARMDPVLSSRASPLPHPSATLDSAKATESVQDIAAVEPLRKAMQEFYHPISQVVDQGRVTALRQGSSVNMQLHDAARPQSLATPDARSTESPKLSRPLSGGTKWPEKSKPRLAAAAKNTLMSIAANAGKEISTEEILSMLDEDPTYSQLCNALERKGFIVHRSQFAQHLLSAVSLASPKVSSSALAQDSPKRGRGRPRNDGLPPRRRDMTLNITQATSETSDSTAQLATTPTSTQRPADQGTTTRPPELYNSGLYADGPQGAVSSIVPLQRPVESAVREPTPRQVQGAEAPKSIDWADRRNMTQESLITHENVDVQTGHLIRTPDYLTHRAPNRSGHNAPAASGRFRSESQPKQGWTPGAPDVKKPQAQDSSPVPLTKAEMARKRSFNEIVDLTQDLSENDAIQRHKKGRTTLHDFQSTSLNHASLATPATNNGSQVSNSKLHDVSNLTLGNPSTTITDLPGLPIGTGPLSACKNLRLGDIVKPLEEKKALWRRTYNGKTIARDILISLGKHPTEKPLNWHLLGLRDNFKNVTNISDLSSFRWDLVDLGGPTPPATKVTNLDGQDARDVADSIKINIGSEAQPAVRPGRTVTVAAGIDSDVDIVDQGKEMDYPPIVRKRLTGLVGNNESTQQAMGTSLRGRGRGSRSRGTVRGVQLHQSPSQLPNEEVQPPEPINKPSRGRVRGRPRGSRSGARGSMHRQPLQQPQITPTPHLPAGISGNQSVVPQSITQSTNAGESQQCRSSTNVDEPQQRQASGPSGGFRAIDISQSAFRDGVAATEAGPSNSERRYSSIQVRLPIISRVAETPSPTPEKRRGRPPGSGKKQPNVENANSADNSDTPKRRGRPLGPSMALSQLGPPSPPKDGISIVVPSRSPSLAISTPSGLRRKAGLHEAAKKKRGKGELRQPTSPSYQIYKCLWEDCQAELHNLETIRKHVHKLHCTQKAKGALCCLWNGCNRLEGDGLGKAVQGLQARYAVFATEDEIREHVEENHLQSLAWKLGDGPTAHPSDVEMSDYLSDAGGRQVTPLIREEGA